MRNLILICAAVVLAACGPSGRDTALAKTARYQGDKIAIFGAVKTTTESKYKLAMSDETTLTLQTVGRWYTPEGLVSTSGEQDIRQVPDRSINIVLLVKLLPEGDNWVVHVQPKMTRINKGSPMPEPLAPNDASLPGWATGKVDQLAFEIHDALKSYEVKAAGGNVAPPPATDPASAPAVDPTAGSGSATP
ncbi:MAG: hypothetical protein H0V17_14235 [Deltaproteobacteria bacterium]|nr:hypothetical protein [Deltaproteobacteria bacterium]